MMRFRAIFLCGVCFALGYWVGSASKPQPYKNSEENETPASKLETINTKPVPVRIVPATEATPAALKILTPSEVYQDYKRKNFHLSMSLVNPGGDVSMQAALILGLSETERKEIEKTFAKAKNAVATKRTALASARMSEDHKTMTIAVPSIESDGTLIYQSALNQIKGILGETRYFLFNEICGDYFDRSFDHFGADEVSYVVSLEGNDTGPLKTYKYERKSTEPDTRQMGATFSTMGTISTAEGADPVLRRFLFP